MCQLDLTISQNVAFVLWIILFLSELCLWCGLPNHLFALVWFHVAVGLMHFLYEITDFAWEVEGNIFKLGRPSTRPHCSNCWTEYWSYRSGEHKTCVLGSWRSGIRLSTWTIFPFYSTFFFQVFNWSFLILLLGMSVPGESRLLKVSHLELGFVFSQSGIKRSVHWA